MVLARVVGVPVGLDGGRLDHRRWQHPTACQPRVRGSDPGPRDLAHERRLGRVDAEAASHDVGVRLVHVLGPAVDVLERAELAVDLQQAAFQEHGRGDPVPQVTRLGRQLRPPVHPQRRAFPEHVREQRDALRAAVEDPVPEGHGLEGRVGAAVRAMLAVVEERDRRLGHDLGAHRHVPARGIAHGRARLAVHRVEQGGHRLARARGVIVTLGKALHEHVVERDVVVDGIRAVLRREARIALRVPVAPVARAGAHEREAHDARVRGVRLARVMEHPRSEHRLVGVRVVSAQQVELEGRPAATVLGDRREVRGVELRPGTSPVDRVGCCRGSRGPWPPSRDPGRGRWGAPAARLDGPQPGASVVPRRHAEGADADLLAQPAGPRAHLRPRLVECPRPVAVGGVRPRAAIQRGDDHRVGRHERGAGTQHRLPCG